MTQKRALELFTYKDGQLFYNAPTSNFRIVPGSPVGSLDKSVGGGYYVTTISKKKWLIHRIIYLMHHGWLPKFIDHIDCNSLNNKIDNLRPATRSENGANRGKQINNSSGYKGVNWDRQHKKWRAQIKVHGVKKMLGVFKTPELAHEAYKKAALIHHKEFAHV